MSRVQIVTAAILPPTAAASAPVFNVQAGTCATPQNVTISSPTAGAAIYVTLDGTAPVTTGLGYHGTINISGSVTINALAGAPGYLPSRTATAAYTITAPPATLINTVAGGGVWGTFTLALPQPARDLAGSGTSHWTAQVTSTSRTKSIMWSGWFPQPRGMRASSRVLWAPGMNQVTAGLPPPPVFPFQRM